MTINDLNTLRAGGFFVLVAKQYEIHTITKKRVMISFEILKA